MQSYTFLLDYANGCEKKSKNNIFYMLYNIKRAFRLRV